MTVDEFITDRVGQVVGNRWTLVRVLGAGGMAAVYAAHDTAGRPAAVKILHPEMSVRRDVRERFLREGVAANRIDHPGAVTVHEQGTIGDDCAFLVMELLEGETLGQRLQRHGTLPVAQVLDILDQVLDVLATAHARGIVHRDLKPDNLFITRDERVKVLDFGLARLLDSVPGDFKTRTGAALGTFPYMAPEQALGRRAEIDGRADLFSLGATAFRILARRKVHEAESDAELLMAMASQPAPPLGLVAPHVPAPVAQVVDLALAFAKEVRYPDARTMQGDVRAVRHGQAPPFASAQRGGMGTVGHSAPPSLTEPMGTPTGVSTPQPHPPVPSTPPTVAGSHLHAAPVSWSAGPTAPPAVTGSHPHAAPERTAPLASAPGVGSLPPVSAGAPLSRSPRSGAAMGKRSALTAVVVAGLALVALVGIVAVAGGLGLVWWWRDDHTALSAESAASDAEEVDSAVPRLVEASPSATSSVSAVVRRPRAAPASGSEMPPETTDPLRPTASGSAAPEDGAPEGSAAPSASRSAATTGGSPPSSGSVAPPPPPPPPPDRLRGPGKPRDRGGRSPPPWRRRREAG